MGFPRMTNYNRGKKGKDDKDKKGEGKDDKDKKGKGRDETTKSSSPPSRRNTPKNSPSPRTDSDMELGVKGKDINLTNCLPHKEARVRVIEANSKRSNRGSMDNNRVMEVNSKVAQPSGCNQVSNEAKPQDPADLHHQLQDHFCQVNVLCLD
ncbi:hypothetical protein HBI56_063190 [Parastagonospora nodorum]|nr:hypothetical protein HBI10_076060 [Parastagonospora nodorum]KAH4025948.1 hypothetical protein HBI13_071870 [Parastagonospora nodorum]KAH4062524.1 hypothetical protein HBH50_204380 [Parastagonospora nodorum]KAH4081079.1 hypothetical protein HBH48_200020 [Parastagonospora nodorum]KAH4106303.1 hypothetical protein HBH46_073710 [Parastagonospora nodorum]